MSSILIILTMIYLTSSDRTRTVEIGRYRFKMGNSQRLNTRSGCNSFLESFNVTFPTVILDEKVIRQIENSDCDNLPNEDIMVGVDVKYLQNPIYFPDPRFEVIAFTNDTKNDYIELLTERERIFPKFFKYTTIGNIILPTNSKQFHEMWKRSTFIKCMNLKIPREDEKVYLDAQKSAEVLAMLRDELLSFGIFPFLNGGTLLGWYRECTVIPHTLDTDFAVFIEDFKMEVIDHFKSNSSDFSLKRILGRPNDSFEITVGLKEGYDRIRTDIFMLYTEKLENGKVQSWVGGTSGDGTKYKYTYPEYDPWCSADLHGHLFWVTCSPIKQLAHEYGKLWYKDHPSENYSWSESSSNVERNGIWKPEEMKQVQIYY